MIGYCPLASSSAGNCVYFGTAETKILIDCGLSGKKAKERLAEIEISIEEIDAIFVTHEHGDHIRGLKVLAFRHGIPLVTNRETARGIMEAFDNTPQFMLFSTGETFEFRDLVVTPFSVPHDAMDPVGFRIVANDHVYGFCTDLGYVTSVVHQHLVGCDYLYLEANHEPSMVHACARPPVYKQRVLGRTGHLSNEACGELLKALAHEGLKHVHLAHLSGECNSPEAALQRVREVSGTEVPIAVVHPHKISNPVVAPQPTSA